MWWEAAADGQCYDSQVLPRPWFLTKRFVVPSCQDCQSPGLSSFPELFQGPGPMASHWQLSHTTFHSLGLPPFLPHPCWPSWFQVPLIPGILFLVTLWTLCCLLAVMTAADVVTAISPCVTSSTCSTHCKDYNQERKKIILGNLLSGTSSTAQRGLHRWATQYASWGTGRWLSG